MTTARWIQCERCAKWLPANEECFDSALRVGIRFCDNDFCNTVHKFLSLMVENSCFRPWPKDLNKSQVAQLFNVAAPGLFWLSQGRMSQREGINPERVEFYRNYLRIDESNVFLGEEIDRHIASMKDGDNGEFQYIFEGKVYCI